MSAAYTATITISCDVNGEWSVCDHAVYRPEHTGGSPFDYFDPGKSRAVAEREQEARAAYYLAWGYTVTCVVEVDED